MTDAARRALRASSAMLRWDVRLQFRYGLYAIYAAITALYVVVLRSVPDSFSTSLLSFVLVADPAVLGFYFIAALVLVEKREGTLDALVVSPVGVDGYLLSKVASLTVLAVGASILVVLFGHDGGFDPASLLAGILLTSVLFVLLGFVAVARFDSINRYFLSAAVYGAVLYAPLLGHFGAVESPLFYLFPIQPSLLLVHGAFVGVERWEVAYAVSYLATGSAGSYLLARRAFRERIVAGGSTTDRPTRDPSDRRRRIAPRFGRIGTLVLTDLRNWSRDPMLLLAAVGPLALALVMRGGLPALSSEFVPQDPARYYPLAAGTLVLFGPYLYGFVVGVFMLEDREQNVLEALRLTPLTGRGYLMYRGVTVYLLSVVGTVTSLVLFDLVAVPGSVLLPVTAVAALGGPIVSFLFASVADDTVEALAINKLLGVPIVVCVAAVAVVPEPLQLLAGLFPPYWPLKALVVGLGGGPAFLAHLAAGLIAHVLALGVFVRRFERRSD